jgi:hypothetical protein
VSASIRYGDAVDVASRAAYRSGYAGGSQNSPRDGSVVPAGVGVQRAGHGGVDQLVVGRWLE